MIFKQLGGFFMKMVRWMDETEKLRNQKLRELAKPIPPGKRKQPPMSPLYRAAWWRNKQQEVRPKGWKDARTKEGKAGRRCIIVLAPAKPEEVGRLSIRIITDVVSLR